MNDKMQVASQYVNELVTEANVIELSAEVHGCLINTSSTILRKLLNDMLICMSYRSSMIPVAEDAHHAINIMRTHLSFVGSVNLDRYASDEDTEQLDENYTSDTSSQCESDSDGDDDESYDDDKAAEDDFDSEIDADDKENLWSPSSGSDNSQHAMHEDDQDSHVMGIFNAQPSSISAAFRDFAVHILETELRSGLDVSDEVLAVLRRFMQRQVTMSFHSDPGW